MQEFHKFVIHSIEWLRYVFLKLRILYWRHTFLGELELSKKHKKIPDTDAETETYLYLGLIQGQH